MNLKDLSKVPKKLDKNIDKVVNGPPKFKVGVAIWVVVALIVALFVFED